MTRVTTAAQGNTYIIEAKGHATGSEAVCSAISAIMYALAGYVLNARDIDVQLCILDDGHATVKFSGDVTAEAVYKMAEIGLLQIEAANADCIKVTENKNFLKSGDETRIYSVLL